MYKLALLAEDLITKYEQSVSKQKGGCVFTLALLALLQIRAKEKAVIRYVALLLNNKNVCGIIDLSDNFTVIQK